jgi:hypothetical protein
MDRIQRERQTVILLKLKIKEKNPSGHVEQPVVLNKLSQVASLIAKDVTKYLCSISPQSI